MTFGLRAMDCESVQHLFCSMISLFSQENLCLRTKLFEETLVACSTREEGHTGFTPEV